MKNKRRQKTVKKVIADTTDKKLKSKGKKNIIIIAGVIAAAIGAHFIIDVVSTRYLLQSEQERKPFFKIKSGKEAIPQIHLKEAYDLFLKKKAVFIDARGENEYEQAHIKGAISIPSGSGIGKIASQKEHLRGKILVTYCHGVGCHLSDKVAQALYDAGYRKIKVFFGGWNEWTAANYPLDTKEQPVPQPEQNKN